MAPVSGEELVEQIDAEGNVVAVVSRSRMRAENLRHRSVGILVVNSRGEVLIHRRAEDKDVWPGQWDIAAGGVVAAGESWEAAAEREIAEELGIVGATLTFVREAPFANDAVWALARYYRALWDGPVRFADGEVVEAVWVTRDELAVRLGRDVFVPDSRAVAADLLSS